MTPNSTETIHIDEALRLVDRELWIITAADGQRRGGLLATWVSAASIDRERPILLAGIGPNHFTAELVQASRTFGAHLLRHDQIDVAWNFARDSGRQQDKLRNLPIDQGQTGAPILVDCLAWFDCRVFARYDAGDRLLFWADIVAGSRRKPLDNKDSARVSSPLCEYEFFRGLSEEQRQILIGARDADSAFYRPLLEKWRLAKPW
jgi:flavin reductase (DIM6/NTAB) family NADH-FMN oxidoreductase RutF